MPKPAPAVHQSRIGRGTPVGIDLSKHGASSRRLRSCATMSANETGTISAPRRVSILRRDEASRANELDSLAPLAMKGVWPRPTSTPSPSDPTARTAATAPRRRGQCGDRAVRRGIRPVRRLPHHPQRRAWRRRPRFRQCRRAGRKRARSARRCWRGLKAIERDFGRRPGRAGARACSTSTSSCGAAGGGARAS